MLMLNRTNFSFLAP